MNITPQDFAIHVLNSEQYTSMVTMRESVYAYIKELRFKVNEENETVRPMLQGHIKKIGAALEVCRSRGYCYGDVVYDTLVKEIQAVNRERARNRERVKTLSFDQAVNKAMLAELNREISIAESNF